MSRTVVVVRGIRRRWKVAVVLLVLVVAMAVRPEIASGFVAGLLGGAS